jgi:Leucine-rich repeat (LRR) protein
MRSTPSNVSEPLLWSEQSCSHVLFNVDLSPLRHLRELRADGNQIASVDGLQNLDSLVKLSLQGNRIRRVDFSTLRW